MSGASLRDGEIGLDAAALVEPLGIDDAPAGHADVVGADRLQDALGIAALDRNLANDVMSNSATASRTALCSAAA